MREIKKRTQEACGLLWKELYQMRKAILCMLCYIFVTQSVFHTVCPIAYLFHIPCPACGLTRSAFYVFTFQWHRAWNLHPLIFLWIPYLGYLLWYRYWIRKRPVWGIRMAVILLAITLWYYGYRMLYGMPEGIIPVI